MDDNPTPKVEGDIIEALDDVPTPSALVNRAGVVRWQNKASVALRGNHLGLNVFDLVWPGDRPQARATFDRVLASGEPAEYTVRGRTYTGAYGTRRARVTLVPVREGEPLLAIYALDISAPEAGGTIPASDVRLGRRQLEILRLLAVGRTTEEIAKQLSLSRVTVRNYIAGTLATLGVHSRLQAVAAARKAGLIDP